MATSGTQRQLTIGNAQIPISEAGKIVTLMISPTTSYATPPVSKSAVFTAGSNVVTLVGSTTADLIVGMGFSVSGVPLPSGLTISSIIDSTSFTMSAFVAANPTFSVTGITAYPTNGKLIWSGNWSGIAIGTPLNSSLYPAGTTITSTGSNYAYASNYPLTKTYYNGTITNPIAAKTVTITGNSIVCTTTSTADLVVGMPVLTPNYFPEGTKVAGITNSTTFTLTAAPTLTASISGIGNRVIPRAYSNTAGGSSTFSIDSTADLIVGMPIPYPTGAKITAINSATTFTSSISAGVFSGYYLGNIAAKTITTTFNSPACTTTSTADLYIGAFIKCSAFPAGTTVATIVDTTNFTASANATLTGSFDAFSNSSNAYPISCTVTGGSKICKIAGGYDTTQIWVGAPLNFFGIFPANTVVESIIDNVSFTASNSAIVSASVPMFDSKTSSFAFEPNSTTVKTGSTADLYVGQIITALVVTYGTGVYSMTSGDPSAIKKTITEIVDSTTFKINGAINLYSNAISGTFCAVTTKTLNLTNNSKTIAITSGNTSDLYVGQNLKLTNYFSDGGEVATIVDSTTFTVKNAANLSNTSYSQTIDFQNDEFMMFKKLGSLSKYYQVPLGKTFVALTSSIAYAATTSALATSAPLSMVGSATSPLENMPSGRLRTPIEPVGAVYYGQHPKDYVSLTSLNALINSNLKFASGTYPFIKMPYTNPANAYLYGTIIGIEI